MFSSVASYFSFQRIALKNIWTTEANITTSYDDLWSHNFLYHCSQLFSIILLKGLLSSEQGVSFLQESVCATSSTYQGFKLIWIAFRLLSLRLSASKLLQHVQERSKSGYQADSLCLKKWSQECWTYLQIQFDQVFLPFLKVPGMLLDNPLIAIH